MTDVGIASQRRARSRARSLVPEVCALAAYLGLAFYVLARLWSHPGQRLFSWVGGSDQLLLQWQLAHAAHAIRHLSNPFFTTDLNAPVGVNLAANANILGLGVPLAPVTMIAGPAVAYAVLATASLALTASAWYWVLSRPLGLNRIAAFVGGLLGGFAPPMIDESEGHQHIVAHFLVPFIAWRVVHLATSRRPVRDGVILGVLIGYQGLIGEETLLLVAIALGVFALTYALRRPRAARAAAPGFLRGVGVCAAVAAAILVVPLLWQFAGPQHFSGSPVDPQAFPADVMDYLGIPERASNWLPGPLGAWHTGNHPTLGLPLVLVLVVFAWPLRKNVIFAGTVAVIGVLGVLSLGVGVQVGGEPTGVAGPWRLVARLPVFEWVIPFRLGLLAAPAAGVALALMLDRAIARWRDSARWAPILIGLTTVVALATLAPAPLSLTTAPAIPRFITEDHWREYVPPGRSLLTVPAPSLTSFDGMRWSASTNVEFAIPGGYFLGPSADGSETLFGPPPVWTREMLDTVARTGQVWRVAPGHREQLLADLRYWRVSVVVLALYQENAPALRATLEQFLGPARQVDDVLIWDVRQLLPAG